MPIKTTLNIFLNFYILQQDLSGSKIDLKVNVFFSRDIRRIAAPKFWSFRSQTPTFWSNLPVFVSSWPYKQFPKKLLFSSLKICTVPFGLLLPNGMQVAII